ncbi:MAG: hypothetical protein ACRC37_05750 [Lentisphaeria bacterium]
MKKIIFALLFISNIFIAFALIEPGQEQKFATDRMLDTKSSEPKFGLDAINKNKRDLLNALNLTISEKKEENKRQYQLAQVLKQKGEGPLSIKKPSTITDDLAGESDYKTLEKTAPQISPKNLLIICLLAILLIIILLKIKTNKKSAI